MTRKVPLVPLLVSEHAHLHIFIALSRVQYIGQEQGSHSAGNYIGSSLSRFLTICCHCTSYFWLKILAYTTISLVYHRYYVELNMCFLRVSKAISDPWYSLFNDFSKSSTAWIFWYFKILQCVSETKTRLGQPEVKRLTNFVAHSELVDRPWYQDFKRTWQFRHFRSHLCITVNS